MALVQQAVGQQGEVGHGVGLHGVEGRVCHDGLQRLLAQRPAQELADALHGATEILGAGEASADAGTPGPEGAPDPGSGCLSPHPDLESGGGGGGVPSGILPLCLSFPTSRWRGWAEAPGVSCGVSFGGFCGGREGGGWVGGHSGRQGSG